MKKQKPPVEENVDLELEYKLLHLYDRLKPYLKYIVAGLIAIILLIIFVIYRNAKLNEKLNQASIYIYKIQSEIDSKKYKEAEKDIKFFKANFADTPYIKLVYALEINLNKEQNKDTKDLTKKLKKHIKTDQFKAYFTEYEGYLDYKDKNYNKALNNLNKIKQNDFNYLSALTLKGIIYNIQGQKDKAKEIFEEINQLSKNRFRYFESFSKESL